MLQNSPLDPKRARTSAIGPLVYAMTTTTFMLTSLLAILGEFA